MRVNQTNLSFVACVRVCVCVCVCVRQQFVLRSPPGQTRQDKCCLSFSKQKCVHNSHPCTRPYRRTKLPRLHRWPLYISSSQFILAQQPYSGLNRLIVEVSRSHTHTSHWVGLLWTRDVPVAETSIWQYTAFIRDRYPCPRRDSNPKSQQASGCRPKPQTSSLLFLNFLTASTLITERRCHYRASSRSNRKTKWTQIFNDNTWRVC
jgi:hypothetical protein